MKPILMADRLVRATIEGRKTQTRRPVKDQPDWAAGFVFNDCMDFWEAWSEPINERGGCLTRDVTCPFGKPGDVLYVRERCIVGRDAAKQPIMAVFPDGDGWRMGEHHTMHPDAPAGSEGWCLEWKRTNSIHMPRWAARLFLEIVDVRVERVNAISEADAMAEGIHRSVGRYKMGGTLASCATARDAFAAAWDEHYAKTPHAWAANPWVWVIDYKVIPAPAAEREPIPDAPEAR